MPNLFALFGFKRSGKDTLAEMIHDYLLSRNIYSYSLAYADPVYDEVWSVLNPTKEEEKSISKNKEVPVWSLFPRFGYLRDEPRECVPPYGSLRWYLNEVGEGKKRIFGQGYYAVMMQNRIMELWRQTSMEPAFIIRDVRFPKEIEGLDWFRENGFHVWTILADREKCHPDWFNQGLEVPPVDSKEEFNRFLEQNKTTISETAWVDYAYSKADLAIENNGTFEETRNHLETWLRDVVLP